MPSAVPNRYPPSTQVAVMVSVAIHSGMARPATMKSAVVPAPRFRAANHPTAKKTAYRVPTEVTARELDTGDQCIVEQHIAIRRLNRRR